MQGKLSGRAVLAILIVSFGIVFAVNGLFIVEAVRTFHGEDVQDSYLQGLDYNQTLDRRAAQAKLGWRASIGAEREADMARIVVTLSSPDGKAISGLHLVGTLRHPADSERDRDLHFAESQPGRYIAEASNVNSGAWDAIVRTASAKQSPFDAERRLWLP